MYSVPVTENKKVAWKATELCKHNGSRVGYVAGKVPKMFKLTRSGSRSLAPLLTHFLNCCFRAGVLPPCISSAAISAGATFVTLRLLAMSFITFLTALALVLFHEDSKITHAVQARFNKACASVGSIFSRYSQLQWANSVQLLVRLQQAILQPCASYGCEVWAPADAAIVPLQDLQSLQHTFLRRACRVESSIPIEVVFRELSVSPWHDFWWRQVLRF